MRTQALRSMEDRGRYEGAANRYSLTKSQNVQSGPRVMPLTFTVGFILFLASPVAFQHGDCEDDGG